MRRLRVALLATAAILAASLTAAILPRKPARLFLPLAAQAAPAKGWDALVPIDPPRPAPALSFQDIDGRAHTLAEFSGRAVLLNLWATWCAPCVAELPSLATLTPRAQQAGIVVLPLSVDHGGTARVRAFFGSHGIDGLPVWNDPDGAAGKAFDVRGIPTTFLIDRQGREVAMLEGAADWGADGMLEALRKRVP